MADAGPRIAHHDLCFGCGLANVFGLHLELEPTSAGRLSGRFFLKQDHQGRSGFAHGGVLASALEEAMSLAIGQGAAHPSSTLGFEMETYARAAVGTYLYVEAWVLRRDGERSWASAELRGEDGERVASGRARFEEAADPEHPGGRG